MTFESRDAVLYTLAFVVPGFVWYRTATLFFVPAAISKAEATLRWFIYSIVNYGIWAVPLYIMYKRDFLTHHPFYFTLFWFVVILVSPVVLGGLTGIARQKSWVRRVLFRLGIHIMEPSPTAWDHVFSKVSSAEGGEWVVVTLRDGKQVFGLFGPNSSASSDVSTRDIYVEHVVGTEPEFTPEDDVHIGMYIPGDQITHIQFRRTTHA
jgi:uncharacterized membrane protein YtjA (UPF0391 family)